MSEKPKLKGKHVKEKKRLTAKEKTILKFNQQNPIGSLMKIKNSDDENPQKSLASSARLDNNDKIVAQLKGVVGFVNIDQISRVL